MSDEELVSHFAQSGDDIYFEELYNRYRHLSYGVCLKLMKDENDSLDVVADVFRILYEKLPTANIQSFRSYLYTVSRNECIGRLRKRQAEYARKAEWKSMQDKPSAFVENRRLVALLDNETPIDVKVEAAVESLKEEQRTCIRLFFYEGKSYREIAELTGYSEKAVKSYLQNGKRNLRIRLEEEFRKHIA
ncbi:MAG: DNA-directed RNA polymerase sigma-70 factor [Saprospiraceae bacterium]|nr:MAG: DNA-directed RNA polymerase sigma-70 factor [Saprospiraceae bacterium]